MKKILIDCRYLGMSGIGRYLEEVLSHFDFDSFDVTLMGKKEKITKYTKCHHLIDDTNPFSKNGMLKVNRKEINKNDFFYSPNFLIPLGIRIKCVTTLHDIIFLDLPEINKNKTELFIKKILLKRCAKKSTHIFTVSNFSKERILHYFPKASAKISFAYQGVAEKFKHNEPVTDKENYVLYVGNIKKHKGLSLLLLAFKELAQENSSLKLFIVGDSTSFRNKDKEIGEIDSPNISFTGKISDEELIDLERKAKFLVQPSFYEGFGIPPLEALYLGVRPIISDIPVFKEVYSDYPVVFFESGNYEDLIDKLKNSNPEFEISKEELDLHFSYDTVAKQIMNELK